MERPLMYNPLRWWWRLTQKKYAEGIFWILRSRWKIRFITEWKCYLQGRLGGDVGPTKPESAQDGSTFSFRRKKQTRFNLGDLFACASVHFSVSSFLWPLYPRLCASWPQEVAYLLPQSYKKYEFVTLCFLSKNITSLRETSIFIL
jgi:hypothetical protein